MSASAYCMETRYTLIVVCIAGRYDDDFFVVVVFFVVARVGMMAVVGCRCDIRRRRRCDVDGDDDEGKETFIPTQHTQQHSTESRVVSLSFHRSTSL